MKALVSILSLSATLLIASSVEAKEMKVLMVSPEQAGIFQTGGLAHATTGLAEALNEEGIKTEVLMPFFFDMKAPENKDTGKRFRVQLDWRGGTPHKSSEFSLYKTVDRKSKNPTLFLRHEDHGVKNYFDNNTNGGPKTYAPDYQSGESFGAFSRAATDYILSQNYDIVILNDWTTGLIAAFLHEAKERGVKVPKVIFTIHNMAYQGNFPKSLVDFLGLPERYFDMRGYEAWGQVNFLKSGLWFSDLIYTVSKTYAEEISTLRFGAGLHGLIYDRNIAHRVTGILNGINDAEWDPTIKKAGLEDTFSSQDLSGKAAGKAKLQKEVGFAVRSDVPMLILTSRMAEQKGFRYLVDAVARAAYDLDIQIVAIGDGEAEYINRFKELAKNRPDRVAYFPFSSALEKKLTRYADAFMNGSWFEPSGLNQMFALKNGTVPVVSSVGGLKDSVVDGKTGFLFDVVFNGDSYDREATLEKAYGAIVRMANTFKDKATFDKMRIEGMQIDNSWNNRVRNEFKSMFDFVLKDGHKQMSIDDWRKTHTPKSKDQEMMCSMSFAS